MMDNAFPIKKHKQKHLDLWPTHPCFFWSRRPFPQSYPYVSLNNWNVSVKLLPSLQQNFTHKRCSSSSFIATLSLIWRTACARVQFSECSLTTNAYSETGKMAVCFQKLKLGALSSRSALSVLDGALFNKVRSLFEQTSYTYVHVVMHTDESACNVYIIYLVCL